MTHALPSSSTETAPDRRSWSRRSLDVPALLTWRDARGTMRFASVVARDLSDYGAFVECDTVACIPLYRLVTLQFEARAARQAGVPREIAEQKVPAAVYRTVAPQPARGIPQGFALRLLLEPRRREQGAAVTSRIA